MPSGVRPRSNKMWTKYFNEISVILDEGLKCQNKSVHWFSHIFYIVHTMKYIFLNYLAHSRLIAVTCMGSIQRLLCIIFMTSQATYDGTAALWRHMVCGRLDGSNEDFMIVETTNLRISLNRWISIEIQLIKTKTAVQLEWIKWWHSLFVNSLL